LVVRDRKVDPSFAENAAHAGGLGFFGDGILEIVHVRESSHAAANHLGGREARAPTDEIFGDVFGFGGEDIIFQPYVERDVVLEATQKSHGNVGVAVDETRQDEVASGIDVFRGSELG